ncbi:PREDICTED: putative Polycomb group protein ASXL1 [Nanorana parkeri]|uniref:putative Polycomb group protein ASXL1 n=1 Tax=Nanorana parkeri TaxID=125878 RepID=UPI000854CBF5|nr:PREDICTED: putative Polycomb group protein ASXL1 [Nanorana parkeri]
MRDKQKRRRERTWAEAAKMVLENYSDAPMTPKQILNVIEAEGLKETKSGSSPLACLNTMLHSNSRTREALFYKLPGRISLFTMKKNAVQWSRVVSLPEDGDTEDTADEESSQWSESNAGNAVESSGSASSSQESHVRETRSLVQVNKQKRRSGVLMPRVVLTPLKVNGAHLPSTSGLSVRRAEGESSSNRTIGSNLTFHRRAALSGNSTRHLRSMKSSPVTGQVKKNKEEEIDFETPGSILVNTNLRALINVRTFNALPHNLQQQLLLLLPEVDRQVTPDGQMKMSGSALNNEFFAHACQRWRERLADGEFTPEMQLRMRQEMGKEKKVEDWKEKFFEDFYGQKLGLSQDPGSDPDEKCNQPDSTCEALQRTSPVPIHVEESLPEIRGRLRRSLCRNRERLQQTLPMASKAKISSSPPPAPPKAAEDASPASENRLSPAEAVNLPSTSDRVPELHPENCEQKRKIADPESSSASFEKKPRMEQRQSFRNTITSVHPEKPQPTKEEPKVPPIRIQLSRIKPPWVVKGLPAYQICPRIIPNPDPPGCQLTPCSPADSQTSGHDLQTSIGGGGGPGGGHSDREKSSWSRDSKRRRSAKGSHGKKPADCCRTQLLPSAIVRDSADKPQVPRVKITWTNSSPETKEHGLSGTTVTKEWHVNEVVSGEVGSGAPSLDYCKGETPDKAANICDKEDPMDVKGGENVRVGRPASVLVGDSMGQGNFGQSETVSCVLGDVSNTFQNRIKLVNSSSTEKDSSDKNSESVMESSQPDLQEATNPPAVESQPASTSTDNEHWDCATGTEPGPCKSINISHVLDVRESDLWDGAEQNQTPKLMGSPRSPSCAPVQTTDVSSLQTDLNFENKVEDALPPNGLNECLKGSLPLADPAGDVPKEQVSECPTLISKDAYLWANASEEPPRSCSRPGVPAFEALFPEEGVINKRGALKVEKHSSHSIGLSTDSGLFQGDAKLRRGQSGGVKQKRSLANYAEPVGKEPLLLDMPFGPFPKEVDLHVKLPMDLLSLPPPGKLKQTLFGKLSKQAQDVASYCYSTGVRLSSFPGEYAVTGEASLSVEVFAEHDSGEHVSVHYSCSFKAMTVCEGCGAFCHIDCIGPSKLCVLCLVIR